MNKSMLNMNRTIGEAELRETVPASLSWELLCARNAATDPEKRADLNEQIQLLKDITPEAQEFYFEGADLRTAEQRNLDEWQAEVMTTRESDYPV